MTAEDARAKLTFDADDFIKAFRDFAYDKKRLAEYYGIRENAVYKRLAKLRKLGLLDEEEGAVSHFSIGRAVTAVFTNQSGEILSMTQKVGDEGNVKFSFLLQRGYVSETLPLASELVEAARRGITFDLACRMIADAKRQIARGGFDARGYLLARLAILAQGGKEERQ